MERLYYFNDYLQKAYENVISDDYVNKYNGYFKNYGDAEVQKDIRKELIEIRDSLKDLDYNDIHISKLCKILDENKHRCRINGYTENINFHLDTLMGIIRRIKDEDTRYEFEILFNKILPEIYIEPNNFNRIHIIEGIPEDLKGIKLGYKIYKALLKKFNYLSSDAYDVNYQAKNVWNKIRKDTDYYTFLKDQKVLSIKTDYKGIIKLLEEFYYDNILKKSNKNILIDPDFLKNVDISNCLLKDII